MSISYSFNLDITENYLQIYRSANVSTDMEGERYVAGTVDASEVLSYLSLTELETIGLAFFRNLSDTHNIRIGQLSPEDEYGKTTGFLNLPPGGFSLCWLGTNELVIDADGDAKLEYLVAER